MTTDRRIPSSHAIADVLRTQIRAGIFAPGDVLPSERRLAESFAVARNTARAAVALLRAEGLVSVVHGKGVFVLPPSTSALPWRVTDSVTPPGGLTDARFLALVVAATIRQVLGLTLPDPDALYGIADLVEFTSPGSWTRCPLCWGVACVDSCVLAPLRSEDLEQG
jgi:DNA-binding transcriptional MocR family regulator